MKMKKMIAILLMLGVVLMPVNSTTARRTDGKVIQSVKIKANKGAQIDFMNCSDDYLAFFSGFGGGKTWAGASKAVINTLIRFRGHDGLVVAPSYGDLETYVIPELLQRFKECGVKAEYKASSPSFVWLWLKVEGESKKIKIHCRSAAHPESIAGFQVAWCWIDEACRIPGNRNPTRDVKTQCIARMRGVNMPGKQMFITSTHEGELTWANLDWVVNKKKGHTYFRGSTFDNPAMRSYAEGLLEQYDPKLVQQYVNGEAVTIAGILIYYAFDDRRWPDGNIDDTVKIDPRKPVVLTMDFNAAPGMHGAVGQYHPELDEIHIVDEIHELGMNVPRLVMEYAARYGNLPIITEVFGDPSGHSRDEAIGETAYAWVARAFQDNNLAFVDRSAISAPLREDRFIATNSALCDGRGRHLRIHSRCERLIRDFKSVGRDDRGRLDKSQELKGYVHMSDAAGYWIYGIRPITKLDITGFKYNRT